MGVTRGSFAVVVCSALRSDRSAYIVRNLSTWISSLLKPIRGWTKKIGPGLENFTSSPVISMTGRQENCRDACDQQVFPTLYQAIDIAEWSLPKRQNGQLAKQMNSVIGRQLNGLGRDDGDVDRDVAELLDESMKPLLRHVRHAEQHLIQLAPAREFQHLVQPADHSQTVNRFHLRAVVGNAQEPRCGRSMTSITRRIMPIETGSAP